MAPGYWIPEGGDQLPVQLPAIMEPLENVRDHSVIMSGLWSQSAEPPPGVTGADHWVASAFMAAEKPRKTTGADIYSGYTVDQMIADHIGQSNLLPSLQLAVEDPGFNSSNCGEGYSCAYTNSISWQKPADVPGLEGAVVGRPLPMEINPQVVFERLFGDGGTPEERTERREHNRSILDSVTSSLDRLKQVVGPTDRNRLDQYLTDVREIERRLEIASQASSDAPAADVPTGVPEAFDDHIKLQFDLNALAFQGDITRVSSLLYARDLTGRSYPFPDGTTSVSFHGGSHHAENADRIREYSKLNQYHILCLAYFAEKLKSIPDGDGTLLDHSLILYGSNMGNSNQHLHYDVPHILIGGASGQLRGGRHLHYPTKQVPTGNLLLSILDLYGIHEEFKGDSNGRLTEL
jgi:hypothetical protein